MSIFLSVDWDFFVREDPLWDWGHSEMIGLFSEAIWSIRALSFLMAGTDLDKEMCPFKHSHPTPINLVEEFSASGLKFEIPGHNRWMVGDSHKYGLGTYGGQDHIVHLDAHHDLGYHSKKTLQRWAKDRRAEAGSWLRTVLARNPKTTAHIIYPQWKGWREYEATDWEEILDDDMFERIDFSIYEDDMFDEYRGQKITGVYLCQSRAWTPPWLDHDFLALVRDFTQRIGIEPWTYEDAIWNERDFDWEEIRKTAKAQRQLMKKLNPSDKR